MRKILIILIIAFAFIGCDDKSDTHTHEWGAWQYNATEHWKECSCGEEYGRANHTGDPCTVCDYETPEPVPKTYIITLKDGALVFTVEYKALPTDEEPAYLTYLKERLTAFAISTTAGYMDAVENLMKKGNSFTIEVEYTGSIYDRMVWNTAKQAFTVHNDWITSASGTSGDNALTLGSMRDAFNSCDYETPEPVPKTYIITLKDGALVFTVEYKALPTDEEPAYLTYLQTRLGLVVNSDDVGSVSAVNRLMSKDSIFTITIKYGEPSFTGMNWNTAEQIFQIHNDWIATATNTDLSAAIIRTAFNSAGYDQ